MEPAGLDPSPLELLADEAGISPDELRAYLRREVERRRAVDAQEVCVDSGAGEA